jgi:hypothetical protein
LTDIGPKIDVVPPCIIAVPKPRTAAVASPTEEMKEAA